MIPSMHSIYLICIGVSVVRINPSGVALFSSLYSAHYGFTVLSLICDTTVEYY